MIVKKSLPSGSIYKLSNTMTTEGKKKSDSLPRKQSAVWVALKTVKTKLSLTNEGSTPLNWKVVFLVFVSLFSSSFNITYLFPFLPEMIKSFGYGESEKGYYAGIVASAMFMGRTCGSYFWGWLSDRKGRRPIMLLTILLNGCFSLAFGFTTNIYFAFITRFLSGLANGTVGTGKTILYEISDDSNQAVSMSIISVAWGLGIVIGPAIGGYLANPCKRYPESFPSEGFFYQFPYIFPGLAAFVICIIAFILDFIMLPETLDKLNKDIDVDPEDPNVGATDDERVSLHSRDISSSHSHLPSAHLPSYLRHRPTMSMSVENLHLEAEGATVLAGSRKELHLTRRGISVTDVVDNDHHHDSKHKHDKTNTTKQQHFYIEQDKHSPTYDDFHNKNSSSCDADEVNNKEIENIDNRATVKDSLLNGNENSEVVFNQNGVHIKHVDDKEEKCDDKRTGNRCCGCWQAFLNWSPVFLIRQYHVFLAVFLYAFFSFGVIGVEEIFTVWASTDILLDGLGFEPNEIGAVLGASSLPLLFLQMFVFPNMVRRMGIKKTMSVCSILLMISTQAIPTLHLLINKPVVMWVLLLFLSMIMKLMTSCVFSCTGLFINNSVAPEWAGSVNGLAMTITAASRAAAPIVGGSIYSWTVGYASENIGPPFDVSFIFFLFGFVYWLNTLVGITVPDQMNRQKKNG